MTTRALPFSRRLRASANALPRCQNCGLGTQEYEARRAAAEQGSRKLLAAIGEHHPERVGECG